MFGFGRAAPPPEPFPTPQTHPQYPWQRLQDHPHVGYCILVPREGIQRLYIFSTRTGETYTRDCTDPRRMPKTILDFVRQHGLESPDLPVRADPISRLSSAPPASPEETARAKRYNERLDATRRDEPPVAASAPLRFEHGELPRHLLTFLRDRGPRSRLELQQSAFGEEPTPSQKARVTDAITALEHKGLIEKLGVRRYYRWRVSAAGKRMVASVPALPQPEAEAPARKNKRLSS